MIEARLTAIVRLTYSATEEMSLDREREYDTLVELGDKVVPCKRFKSPIGDERWRETVRTIRTSTEDRDRSRGSKAGLVAGVGYDLFLALADLARELADFLAAKTSRRLVIMSVRPEIHALPWEALSNRGDHGLELLAVGDLSIVRCTQVFTTQSCLSPPLVHIYSKFGPDTNDDVLRSAQSVRVSNVSGRPVGVAITDQTGAEIVNLVAHGSEKDEHRAQTLVDEDRSLSPEQLASEYQGRLMVLMWSCFSAMVHSWGASPTLALHAAGNVFVLGFVAPLSLKASAEIAQRFYDSVFGAAGSQDPERAITEIRAWQFKEEYEFCDWASMTVWLRQPLDLSALPLGTVRVPEAAWSATAAAVPQRLRDVLGRDAALGDARLLQGVEVTAPFPDDLIEEWRGPVIVMDGRAAAESDSPFHALQIDTDLIPSRHPADRFLSLLAQLETYRYSLLLWINVSSPEVMLIETLDRIPPNVAILLTSPYRIQTRWPGSVATDGDTAGRAEPAPACFIDHVMREDYDGALARAVDGAMLRTDEDFSCLYLAAIKRGRLDLAQEAIARVRSINPLEADLLQGNLDSREGRHRQARERYQSVLERARADHALREEARAQHELAYVANEMGDRGLADQMFRNAIATLEGIEPKQGDSRWHSALARALRDYADLLADQGSPEALALLRRATAIHAFERRPTQVAYCFLSRSKLMLRLGRFESAAADAEQAAIVFSQAGNADGWVAAITLAARAASARNCHDQARAVLNLAASHYSVQGKDALIGKLLLEAAEVALVAGSVDHARKLAKDSLNRLPVALQRERAAARKLQQFVETLL
jgi:tetratricopeptide (TPR) repeat protein